MGKRYLPIFCALAMMTAILTAFFSAPSALRKESYLQFVQDTQAGKLISVKLCGDKLEAVRLDGDRYWTDNPDTDRLVEKLLLSGIQVERQTPSASPTQLMSLLSITALVAGCWSWNKRDKQRQLLESACRPEGSLTFADVAGNAEAIAGMRQLVDVLHDPKRYVKAGARLPRGVLLYGPPGTGKTLLARAVAGEAGVPFLSATGSDFVQMYVGVGAKRVRELFRKAREHGKCVIFIDEIDALGKQRGAGEENSEREQTLNALLSEMSGFSPASGLLVIAATNRPETLDEALTRPGRFDRRIEVGLPDVAARRQILSLLGGNKNIDACVDMDAWAARTTGFSGAGLESLVNEAALLAAGQNTAVTEELLEKAYISVLVGEARSQYAVHPKERPLIAVHEAGHALASRLLLPEEPVVRVTIIPSVRGAGGYVLRQVEERMPTYQAMRAAIQVALAGRAAEALTYGQQEITGGAANDLQYASSLARRMLYAYAMEPDAGLLVGGKEDEARLRGVLRREYEAALALLEKQSGALAALRDQLLEKETLTGGQVDELLAKWVG